jgi:hypothetical protein
MRRALVVVESMFGNTRSLAGAVADGLATRMQVEVVGVGDAPSVIPRDVELVVVGGPTHAFSMTRPGTRLAAFDQGAKAHVGTDIGIREWLAGLDRGTTDPLVAAFDTRIRKAGVPGSAARAATRRLRRLGFRVTAPAQSFYVMGTSGPLLDGELGRARVWGAQLANDNLVRVGGSVRAATLQPEAS